MKKWNWHNKVSKLFCDWDGYVFFKSPYVSVIHSKQANTIMFKRINIYVCLRLITFHYAFCGLTATPQSKAQHRCLSHITFACVLSHWTHLAWHGETTVRAEHEWWVMSELAQSVLWMQSIVFTVWNECFIFVAVS